MKGKEFCRDLVVGSLIVAVGYLICPKDKWDAMTHKLAVWIKPDETLQDVRRKSHMSRWHRFGPDKEISPYKILNMQLEGKLSKCQGMNIMPYLREHPGTLEGYFNALENIINVDFCVDSNIRDLSTDNYFSKESEKTEYRLRTSVEVMFYSFGLHSEILDQKDGNCVDIWSNKKF